MQVARTATTASPTHTPGRSPSSRAGPSYTPLYLTSTLRDISFDIEELEGIALDRLNALKAAEAALNAHPHPAAHRDAIRSAIWLAERNAGLNIPPVGNSQRDSRILKDEASHFLLRLALCKTHEHRNWLLRMECELFSTRVDGAGADFALEAIARAHGPVVSPVTPADYDRFKADLDAVARGACRMNGAGGAKYFTVAFEEVPALVRGRRVFLHKGLAYVPADNIQDIAVAQFRSKLSLGLVTASKAVGLADSDSRMRPILESIRRHYEMDEKANKDFDPTLGIEKISLKQLNESIPAMPLCMANMMTRLREQHHLRHAARMQLGVFLKGCGLTLNESLLLWKTEFGKGSINAEKFEKSYAYNIRHHYGKEGKRRNLPPFPCMRIINDRPGPGEHNGCPYREFEQGRLKQALRAVGADVNAIPAIAEKAREGNFQTACGMCFVATQPGHHAMADNRLPEFVPTHPNEYFLEARRRRFAPQPDEQMLDDIDEEEFMLAAEAAETHKSTENTPTPAKSVVKKDLGHEFNACDEHDANAKSDQAVFSDAGVAPETPDGKASSHAPEDAQVPGTPHGTEENADKALCTPEPMVVDNATSPHARIDKDDRENAS